MRDTVVEVDEVVGQFETDVAVDETPQLRGHDLRILRSDPTGVHEPCARFGDVRVGTPEGRRASTQPGSRVRDRSVRRAGGKSEHQVVQMRILASDPSAGQGLSTEVGDRILRHRHPGEGPVELSESMVDNGPDEFGDAAEVAVDHHRRQAARGRHAPCLDGGWSLLGQQSGRGSNEPLRHTIGRRKSRPVCRVST